MASSGGIAAGAGSGAAAGAMGGPVGIAIGAGFGALGSIFSGKQQSKAATKSAQIQSASADRAAQLQAQAAAQALAFQREEARRDAQRFEATQRANYNQWASGEQLGYDQWAARERRLGTLGDMLGVGQREIPAFKPPPYESTTGNSGPAGSADASAAMALGRQLTQGMAATPDALVSIEPKLNAKGIKVLRNAAGIAGKVQLPNGHIIDVGKAFSSGDPSQMAWQWDAGTGAAPASATTARRRPMLSGAPISSYMQPNQPQTAPIQPIPYSVGSYF